jgi:deoxyguanosine kinase
MGGESMDRTPFITVEGPIGVGKTSLAEAISNHFNFSILNEIVEENPFLGKFYDDIEEWSFQTEMFFLCNRFKQMEDIKKKYLDLEKPVVSDYHIFKNRIFATRTLKDEHFNKYMKIFDILTEGMPTPNMVIYIKASIDTLVERIKLRARKIEENIDTNYLIQLAADYEMFMYHFEKQHPEIPVIVIDGDNIDFIKNPEELSSIFNKINQVFQREEVTK